MDPTQQSVPPDVLAAYMHQLTSEQEDQDLQQQLTMARELMQPGPQRYGPWGTGFQAIADMVGALGGQYEKARIGGERKKLRTGQEQSRDTIGKWWLGTQQPQQSSAEIPEAVPGFSPQMVGPQELAAQSQIPALLRNPGLMPGGMPNLGKQKLPPPLTPEQIHANAGDTAYVGG